MKADEIDAIIEQYGKAWVARDPGAVTALFAKDGLEYFESTFGEPATTWDRVAELWSVVPSNQRDLTWWHEIMMVDANRVLVHVKVTRTMVPSEEFQDIDGAFVFGFDSDGLINYFRQWRMLRG